MNMEFTVYYCRKYSGILIQKAYLNQTQDQHRNTDSSQMWLINQVWRAVGPTALSPRDRTVEPMNAAKLLNIRVCLACVHRPISPTSKLWVGPWWYPESRSSIPKFLICLTEGLAAHTQLPSLDRDLTSSSPVEHLLFTRKCMFTYVLSEAEKKPWCHWKLYKSTLKMFLNSITIPLVLQFNFLHTAGLHSGWTETGATGGDRDNRCSCDVIPTWAWC